MYTIDKNIINKIINETDIVALIGQDIKLEKKGSNFIGLCPFHQDNNPSFTVSPDKKIYKCLDSHRLKETWNGLDWKRS